VKTSGGPLTVDSLLKDVSPDWAEILRPEMEKEYFGSLLDFVNSKYNNGTVHPSADKVFAAFAACPFKAVRVVILGQDPYPTPGNAHGLCFSVEAGVAPPQSLKNMYKELVEDPAIQFAPPKPPHGHLLSWAQQGVLLLNTILTVDTGAPMSHKAQGWEKFTDFVINAINNHKRDTVFVLWGKPSQQKGRHIDKGRHCIIECAHPSPLSATKGFFGSRCFSLVNGHLTKTKQPPIDWQLPPISAYAN